MSSESTTDDDEFTVEGNLLSRIALPVAIAIVGVSVGISLQVQDFVRMRQQPFAAFLGLACQLILVPAVGWTLALLLDVRNELAVGMVLLTVCPGGSSSNYVSVMAGGDGALSVSLTAVSSIVTTFTIPVFLDLAIRRFMDIRDEGVDGQTEADDIPPVDIDIFEIMLNIALLTLLPVAVGMIIKHSRPQLADRILAPLQGLAAVLLTAMLVAAMVAFRSLIRDAFGRVAAPTALLIACMMSLSYGAALMAGLQAQQRITICIESSIQYSGLAMAIGLSMLETIRNSAGDIIFDREKIIMPAAIYTVFLYPVGVGFIAVCWYLRSNNKEELLTGWFSLCQTKKRSDTDDAVSDDGDGHDEEQDSEVESGHCQDGKKEKEDAEVPTYEA
mmetsp:Transcript_16103/g.30651  ORF Transcript_16103/g.30651 Transcript_16103/m.30651 type:complete len:388 (-) Transcript_16103:341-1504(-)|eukprot:scaffold45076_cov214-Amphora_coffeaeformis.AAC.1